MEQTWVLVANSSEARLFEMDKYARKLSLLDAIDHPESRKKDADLSSDRSGHFQGEHSGASHGAFNEATSPKTYEHERFAMELADILDEGRNDNRYGRLVVVSSPRFRGMLNKHLNNQVSKMVWNHVDKDYTQVHERDLLSKLTPHLKK